MVLGSSPRPVTTFEPSHSELWRLPAGVVEREHDAGEPGARADLGAVILPDVVAHFDDLRYAPLFAARKDDQCHRREEEQLQIQPASGFILTDGQKPSDFRGAGPCAV